MSIRSFIALPIPIEMANALGDAAAQMTYQDKSNAVRWVNQENYHLTLAFLGDLSELELEVLADQLDINVRQTGFDLCLSHFSPFPESRPKLLAAIIANNEHLSALHKQVHSALSACQITLDRKKFLPHITLGRFRHSKNSFAGAIPRTLDLSAHIDEVTIFESRLTTHGAEYEPLFRFPLDEDDTSIAGHEYESSWS